MAFAPIITRLYGPEAFGLLGTFMAALAIMTPIAALSYPIAIVLPKADDDAKGLAQLSLRIALVITILLGLILLAVGDSIATLLGMQAIASFMWLIPLAMLFSAMQQIMQQWLIRKKQFKVSARVALSQSLIVNLAKTGAGLLNPIGAVLIIISTLGNALYAAQLWFGAKKWAAQDGRIDKATKPVSLTELAHRHRDFPYYRAPQVFINAVSQGLPVLMLTSLFGPAAAGFYSLGRTVMGIPSSLVGRAIGSVLYPKLNETYIDGNDIFSVIFKTTILLGAIGLIPFGVVVAFGPDLFEFVFGAEWHQAGIFARWLAIFLFFGFINRPSVVAIPILGIQRGLLIYEIFSTAGKIIALWLGFYIYNDASTAVMFFAISGAITYIALILWVLFYAIRN